MCMFQGVGAPYILHVISQSSLGDISLQRSRDNNKIMIATNQICVGFPTANQQRHHISSPIKVMRKLRLGISCSTPVVHIRVRVRVRVRV